MTTNNLAKPSHNLSERSVPVNREKLIEEVQSLLGDKWEDFKEYVDGIKDWDMHDVERYLNR